MSQLTIDALGKMAPKGPTIYDLLNATDWSIEDVLRRSEGHVQGEHGTADIPYGGDFAGARPKAK